MRDGITFMFGSAAADRAFAHDLFMVLLVPSLAWLAWEAWRWAKDRK